MKKTPIPEHLNLALAMEKLPIATPDMTEDELRDLVVSFMRLQINFAFTPTFSDRDEYRYYIKNRRRVYGFDGCRIPYEKGKYYGGVPYVGNAAGSLYRWLEFYNAETGEMDFDPIIRTRRVDWVDEDTGISYPDVGSAVFGNSCAASCIWSFLRVTNKIDTVWTSSWLPKNGFILVGDYELNERGRHGKNTKELCEKNGKQRMFAAYSKAKRADGLIKSGHAMLCVSDAVTVYDENGDIDGEKSYIHIAEQKGSFVTRANENGERFPLYSPLNDEGDTYRIMGNFAGNTVNGDYKDMKRTFESLIGDGYLPFTVPELCGRARVDVPEVQLYKEDEAFTEATVKASELKNMTVKSNYAISDIHFIIKDENGAELFNAMYADYANEVITLKTFSVESAFENNPIYQDADLIGKNVIAYARDGKNTLTITARLSNGGLYTVYKGTLAE